VIIVVVVRVIDRLDGVCDMCSDFGGSVVGSPELTLDPFVVRGGGIRCRCRDCGGSGNAKPSSCQGGVMMMMMMMMKMMMMTVTVVLLLLLLPIIVVSKRCRKYV